MRKAKSSKVAPKGCLGKSVVVNDEVVLIVLVVTGVVVVVGRSVVVGTGVIFIVVVVVDVDMVVGLFVVVVVVLIGVDVDVVPTVVDTVGASVVIVIEVSLANCAPSNTGVKTSESGFMGGAVIGDLDALGSSCNIIM